MAVRKVVGLEGFCNSGKSSVMRSFAERLREKGKVIAAFDYLGGTVDPAAVVWTSDFIVVVEYDGRLVLIVTGGDYVATVSIVIKILLSVQIKIDIAFVAMRKAYPAVGAEYRAQVKAAFGVDLKTIFKPGYKRIQELSKEEVCFADTLWINALLEEII